MGPQAASYAAAPDGPLLQHAARSDALPKLTLFGSSLEKLDRPSRLKMLPARPPPHHPAQTHPHLATQLKSIENINDSVRRSLADYLYHNTKRLQQKQPQSKATNLKVNCSDENQLLTMKPKDHMEMMSENKQTDGLRQRSKNEFKPEMSAQEFHEHYVRSDGRHWRGKQCELPQLGGSALEKSECIGGLQVPKNLAHRGTVRQSRQLLADADQVKADLDVIKAEGHRASAVPLVEPNVPVVQRPHRDVATQPLTDYAAIGQMIRSNVIPGGTDRHHGSLEKDVYSWNVFSNREADSHKFHYKKNDHTVWREHNIIYGRMKKSLQQLQDSRSMKDKEI